MKNQNLTARRIEEILMSNPDAVVLFNEHNDRLLAIAADIDAAKEIADDYTKAWHYRVTIVVGGKR